MRLENLSPKQARILDFTHSGEYALICDGAVRSGKTVVMGLAFLVWAMAHFNGANFAICGKTVQSAERNVVRPLMDVETIRACFSFEYKISTRVLSVKCGNVENRFYVFGGKDESSYMLIQGITLAGVMFDEVALMPQSFVEQAIARTISYSNAKLFFNCNPESPAHYFYREWIEHPKPNTKHLHFLLEDNPIMSPEMIERTKAMYSGVFYDRYIRGLWVAAEGLIYDMFDRDSNVYTDETAPRDLLWNASRVVSVDYGTANPTVFLDSRDYGETTLYIEREYYFDSRAEHRQKTDTEYADDMEAFLGDKPCPIIVDPSAASFIEELRRRGLYVLKADNTVVDGIRKTAALVHKKRLLVHERCKNTLREFGLYSWDRKAADDRPIKENDHAMDALRYRVSALPKWRFEA